MSGSDVPLSLRPVSPAQVQLDPSLFQQRWRLNRDYLASLQVDHLLQNHRFEAGMWGPPGRLEGWHEGWHAPNSLVRGHFLGHWMGASARIVQATGDPELRGKLRQVVAGLAECQEQNGGEWVLSIPERYFDRLERGLRTWAVQYVAEKTLTGLLEAYRWTADEQALGVLTAAAGWFLRWVRRFSPDQFDVLLDYETGAMLRLWADLFAITGDPTHEELMRRYVRRQVFDRLLAGEDVLTNRHANTTLPEAQGMARAFEVTGESYFRDATLAYWDQAVTRRGYFATGGQTCGEVWTPPGQLGGRLGDRNQEHCVVFNAMGLAEFLLRWTGDVSYADYRERNLWNGILAQQHPTTGMVTYFLPLRGGAQKTWSTPTKSFWCCVGTLVEAHSRHGTESWYEDDDGLVLVQPVPGGLSWSRGGAEVSVRLAAGPPVAGHRPGRVDLSGPDLAGPAGEQEFHLKLTSRAAAEFTLRLRVPWWVDGTAQVEVDGEPVKAPATPSSWVAVRRRWEDSTVHVRFPRRLAAEALPGRPDTYAFLDGPVVLAGLLDAETAISADPADPTAALSPQAEREWDRWTGHWLVTGQSRAIRMVPLHEVTDETYSVYFPVVSAPSLGRPAT